MKTHKTHKVGWASDWLDTRFAIKYIDGLYTQDRAEQIADKLNRETRGNGGSYRALSNAQ